MFERLFYFGLALGALNLWAAGSFANAHARLDQSALVALAISGLVQTGLNLLFLWLIAYRGSNVVRWFFICLVALSALSTLGYPRHARDYGDLSWALSLTQTLLCAIEIALLFRRDSQDWFAGVRYVDHEIFR